MRGNGDLAEFIVEARETGSEIAQSSDDDRTLRTYERGDWSYRDVSYGSTAVTGHEVVTYMGNPTWGLSYYGDLTTPAVDADEVNSFLRDALGRATTDRPYRGPERLERDDLEYRSSIEGDHLQFEGTERIVTDGATVYRGRFVGGRID